MLAPPRPLDDAERLASLRDFELLDTPAEAAFDDLTTLATHICDAPISMISLVDDHRQWFKSRTGFAAAETPRETSFCGHAILGRDLFVVADAAADDRFADNPLVTGDPHVRFYAGTPLVTSAGHALGTLCVMDRVPRTLSPSQQNALRVLGRQVMAQLELRRQARELRKSDARLRLVTDHSRAGLVILDRHRRYVYANAAYAEILGLTTPAIVGLRVADVLPELYDSQIRPRLDLAFAGARVTYELRRQAPEGESHYAVRYEPSRVADTIEFVVVVITDVTEQKAAVLASGRLAAIVQSSNDAILSRDLTGLITSWNAAAERLFGYASHEVMGTPLTALVPADRADELRHILDRIRQGEAVPAFETVRQTRNGRRIDVSLAASPIKDDNGQTVGASIIARDITEKKRAEATLRDAEERMRFALENADVGIWDVDYVTGTARWSAILEAQYGLAPGTFAGTFEAFLEHVHPEDRQHVRETIGGAMAHGADFSLHHRIIRPDGSVRWLSGAGRVHLGPTGDPVRSVGISLDITERQSLEAQYQQAQKMEAVGRLAGGVAHDFNNLLTAILGYCELLLEDLPIGDPRAADVAEIQKAGKSAAALTRQLLAFSRKQIVEPTLLDMNVVVSDMRGMLGRVIGEDIEVVLDLSADAAFLMADRGQLEQVLMNLAVNARDAMLTGGTLTIATRNARHERGAPPGTRPVKEGEYIALDVRDTGMGMTPDIQAHLFEPFFTTKEQGKGTGLGLATVHGIVTRAGGHVTVESSLGRGTTFTIYWPRTDATGMTLSTSAATPTAWIGAIRILVVEDAEGLGNLTRRLLEPLGCSVRIAGDAEEALRLFAADPDLDVLLTDVVMPGMSGPELARQLTDERPDLKVVYMSGYTEEAIVHHGVLKPGISLLHKPFTAETLARKLFEVTAGPGPTRHGRSPSGAK
jgi:two-component system, cell cycle sensor histidine kinase and response regulator CckA